MNGGAVIIHELADATAALQAAAELGVAVTLLSAPGGAVGPGWFEAVIREARAAFPEVPVTAVFDCGDRADVAQAALRQGLRDICFRGPAALAARLADIAGQRGAVLHRSYPPALDPFGVRDRLSACRAWLSERSR